MDASTLADLAALYDAVDRIHARATLVYIGHDRAWTAAQAADRAGSRPANYGRLYLIAKYADRVVGLLCDTLEAVSDDIRAALAERGAA